MNLIRTIPAWIIIACILLIPLTWSMIGNRVTSINPKKWQLINKIVLVVWLGLLIYGTLLSRLHMNLTAATWDFVPFNTLNRVSKREILLNVMMFEPIGMTLIETFKYHRPLQLVVVAICGLAVSASIEILQQILVLGSFQMDDIIWNTVGCVIGTSGKLILINENKNKID